MKRVGILFRSIALGLAILTVHVLPAGHYTYVSTWGGPPLSSGTVYSVPLGASVEWNVYAWGPGAAARLLLSGGGLSENTGSVINGADWDVTSTTTAGDISYYLSADLWYPEGGTAFAELYVGW